MAKINLGLDVLSKRSDGYHEVRMIMQSIRLHDKVSVTPAKKGSGIQLRSSTIMIPSDASNLAWKAADALYRRFHMEEGVRIDIHKRIPVAAGLGGGSADAAAVLVGINQLFSLGLTSDELCAIGGEIGADVPFCVLRGCALAEGIGEKLTPLPTILKDTLLVARPDLQLSTPKIYAALDEEEELDHPDIDGMVRAIRENKPEELKGLLGNCMQDMVFREYPEVKKLRDTMLRAGARVSVMSGSGPSVYGLFENSEDAEKAMDFMAKNRLSQSSFITGFYGGERTDYA